MTFHTLRKILSRVFHSYVKKDLPKVFFSLLLSFGVAAGSTASIAWLLDPAIKKMFLEHDQVMMLLIPIAIILAFLTKGLTLYFARIILIRLGNRVAKDMQVELAWSVLQSDTHTLESKHSGKYLANFLNDVGMVIQMVSSGILNLMKDTLTLIVLVCLMFYQNWKLALFALIMMPLAAFIARSLGKQMGKATTKSLTLKCKFDCVFIRNAKRFKINKNFPTRKI